MTSYSWQLIFLFLGALVLVALGVFLQVVLEALNIKIERKTHEDPGYDQCSRPGCRDEAEFYPSDDDNGYCSWRCFGRTKKKVEGKW
jgi:hypothetical protein